MTDFLPLAVREYLSEIGRRGGRIGGKASTQAKRIAVKRNGKLGGRPNRMDAIYRRTQIKNILEKCSPISQKDLIVQSGVPSGSICYHLKAMEDSGIVKVYKLFNVDTRQAITMISLER